jgi:hypothetical protein
MSDYKDPRPTAQDVVLVEPFETHAIGRAAYGTIRAKVFGYWSRDPISITIQRNWFRHPDECDTWRGTWRVSLSHSSGGRDTSEVADDLQAARNLAQGLCELADVGAYIVGRSADLEAAYQERVAEDRAERERADAARAAAFDADEPLGEQRAAELLRAAVAMNKTIEIVAYARGSGSPEHGAVCVGPSGKTTYKRNFRVASRAAMIAWLAAMSHSTKLLTEEGVPC